MRIETSPYSKTLYVWNTVSAIFFYGGLTPPHSHNTMQLVFDIRKTFRCRIMNTAWQSYQSVIIKENAIHQLDANDSVQLIVYLDAENEIAKSVRLKYLSDSDISSPGLNVLDHVRPGELEQCLIEPNAELLERLIHHLLNRLVDSQPAEINDERINTIIHLLATNSSEKTTIGYLAKKVFLSESRLRDLFKKETGTPLHHYIIWNRVMFALNKILNGATVQDAALECGFTDSSHFHKLLLKMFGVSPSQFIKNNSKKHFHIAGRDPLDLESRFYDDETGHITKVYKMRTRM